MRVSLCDRCVLIVFAHFTSVDAARSLTDMLCAEVQKIYILVCRCTISDRSLGRQELTCAGDERLS